MPDNALGSDIHDPPEPSPGLSGTKLHQAIGAGTGAGVIEALKSAAPVVAASPLAPVMGLTGLAAKLSNIGAVALIAALFAAAFFWLRADAMAERAEYRQQVLRWEEREESRRREDRQDRQRSEDLFRSALETISRDSRDTLAQMKIMTEQLREAIAKLIAEKRPQ